MSGFDLHEFNVLSKRHNYFMTNNRMEGFPTIKENSFLLKKVLANRSSNSTDKVLEIQEYQPKKFVRFADSEKVPINSICQSPILIKKIPNNSNENTHRRYKTKLFDKDNIKNHNINSYRKISLNKKVVNPNYYKIPINMPYKNKNYSPDSSKRHSPLWSNSNINDSDNDIRILSFKGRKIFTTNSFGNLKNDIIFESPQKFGEYNNIKSELFRNSEELKKKKEEIYLRKMKRETSFVRREILRKEKDKEIKNKKINIDIKNNNNIDKDKDKNKDKINKINKMRIIPISKKKINDNKKKNHNRFLSNDLSFKDNSINLDNSNSNIKSRNKINNEIQYNSKRKIYNMNNNISKVSSFSNISNIFSKEASSHNSKDKDINPINNNNMFLYSKKKLNNNNNNNNNNNIISISKNKENSSPKNNINYKIKENLEFLRKTNHSGNKSNDNKIKKLDFSKYAKNNKDYSPFKFVASQKRFVEDYTYRCPVIYSNDKKVSIRVHTIQNLNETFFGKKNAKEKLKMQRVISICIKNNKKELINKRNIYTKKAPGGSKLLSSIKEEEEKSKPEPKSKKNLIKQKNDKKDKPGLEKNTRRRYLPLYGKKNQ